MHPSRALQNNDILREIFQCLANRNPTYHRNRKALVRSARVCKAFFDPALDVLWGSLDNLLPLFKIFTPFVKVRMNDMEAEHGVWTDVYCLCGDITEDEWTRFQQYARRVRTLCHDLYGTKSNIDSMVYTYLVRHNKGQPLLPFLRELEWGQLLSTNMDLLAFASPTLRRFRFQFNGKADRNKPSPGRNFGLQVLIRTMLSVAPGLKDVSVSNFGNPLYYMPITRCSNIRKVEITDRQPVLNVTILQALSTMKNLADLSLIPLTWEEESNLVSVTLTGLQRLVVKGTARNMTRFFKILSAPNLCSLVLRVQGDAHHAERNFHDCLVAACTQYGSSLRAIHLLSSFHLLGENLSPVADVSLMGFIEPLLGLHDIETISIRCGFNHHCKVSAKDQDIHDMATAWPNLTELDLSYRPAMEAPSIASIVDFALLCPKLRTLALPSLNTGFPSNLDQYPILSHNLRKLRFGYPTDAETDSLRMAQFIDRFFPNLDTADDALRYLEQMPDERVVTLLIAFQSVRKQQVVREKADASRSGKA
ncbi:hypothetical protein AcV7_001152 [Taiwanofungus camphoratus]|nr:hypothetical protein AcV7_001152 [Antrodia cinnamomea]